MGNKHSGGKKKKKGESKEEYLTFDSGLPDCCTAFAEGYQQFAKNATGRLVQLVLKAGQSDPPHDHPKHHMYFVQGGKLTITSYAGGEKGEAKEIDFPTGAAPIFPAGPRQVTNSGDVDVRVVFVEVTGESGDGPEVWTEDENQVMKSPCDTNPECYKILAEDEDWITMEMNMGPGTQDSPHGHRNHFLYVVGGDEVTTHGIAGYDYMRNGVDTAKVIGDEKKLPLARIQAMPMPAGHLWIENTGSQHCKIILFEPKDKMMMSLGPAAKDVLPCPRSTFFSPKMHSWKKIEHEMPCSSCPKGPNGQLQRTDVWCDTSHECCGRCGAGDP